MTDLRRQLLWLLLGLFALAAALAALVFALASSLLSGDGSYGPPGVRAARALLWTMPLLLPLYAVCVCWGYTVMVRSLARPAERLLRRMEGAGGGGAAGLPVKDSGSFARLAHALSELLEQLAGERDQLRQTVEALEQANRQLKHNRVVMARAERLAGVGRLAAGMAHEIGNPLGIASGYMQLLQDESIAAEERREYQGRALRELERIDGLIRRLLLCARDGSGRGEWQPIAVSALVRDLLEDLRLLPPFKDIALLAELRAARDTVLCDPGQLRQVLLNCLLNGVDALVGLPPDRSRRLVVTVQDGTPEATGGAWLELVVSDTGGGIAPEDLPLVFDPFFTSKEPGRGTGLGLSVCHAIVTELGGTMSIESTQGLGTAVKMRLPLADKEES